MLIVTTSSGCLCRGPAVAVKSVMEHTARSFLSERQKEEKPDLLSKTFSALKVTHYMAQ